MSPMERTRGSSRSGTMTFGGWMRRCGCKAARGSSSPTFPSPGTSALGKLWTSARTIRKKQESLEKYLNMLVSQLQCWNDEPQLAQFIGPDAPGQVLRAHA
mmetsp:Transcript_85238/g.214963  ORF Transcript_85238/g.214963 Transcript_85238/m.214963 type:complete len:101 (-) Transcript_85238:141-443(-)